MEDTPCTYRISVKAIIKDDNGKILLIRESDGYWELPGGGLDQGEDPHSGLRREIKEELGCSVEKISDEPVSFWTIRKEVGSPKLKWFAFVAYHVKISGTISLNQKEIESQEIVNEIGYFSPEEARSLKLHDNVKAYFN